MRRLTDWLKRKRAPVSYAVEDEGGGTFFVEARRCGLDRDGRLLFRRGRRLIAAVQADRWRRVREGLTLEDFEEE